MGVFVQEFVWWKRLCSESQNSDNQLNLIKFRHEALKLNSPLYHVKIDDSADYFLIQLYLWAFVCYDGKQNCISW